MNIPANLRYTSSHEWLRRESDGTVTVGITDHAQQQLGDLVFIELPAVGRKVGAGEACAVVESVKAASDVYSPLAGEIVATNADAVATPTELTARDRQICGELSPALKKWGMMFVGIDVIDGHLTEINVTSPTGIREMNRLYGLRLEADLVDRVAERVRRHRGGEA